MKAQRSQKKKSNALSSAPPSRNARGAGGEDASLRLSLSIHRRAASRRRLSERRLRRAARCALQAARQRDHFAIALAFVGDRTMRRLNRQFAGHDYTTDVLSFAAREHTSAFHQPSARVVWLGDIVISLPQAARQAHDAGHRLACEVDLLMTHGVLHLLGYDHATPRETKQMRALERQALRKSKP